jgi:hypothetical protein
MLQGQSEISREERILLESSNSCGHLGTQCKEDLTSLSSLTLL